MLEIYSNTCLLSRNFNCNFCKLRERKERLRDRGRITLYKVTLPWNTDPVLAWSNILTFLVAIVFVSADIFWCLMPFKIHFMSFLHWNAVQRLLKKWWLHEIWPNFDLLDSIYEYLNVSLFLVIFFFFG